MLCNVCSTFSRQVCPWVSSPSSHFLHRTAEAALYPDLGYLRIKIWSKWRLVGRRRWLVYFCSCSSLLNKNYLLIYYQIQLPSGVLLVEVKDDLLFSSLFYFWSSSIFLIIMLSASSDKPDMIFQKSVYLTTYKVKESYSEVSNFNMGLGSSICQSSALCHCNLDFTSLCISDVSISVCSPIH